MSDPLIASLLLVAFAVASVLADRLRPAFGWVPLALLAVACALGFRELARYDLGHGQLLFAVGQIGAPVGAILGGASWGTRRFYGWPDLGPVPSRLGLVCAAVLLGVLWGARTREDDVARSRATGERLRQQALAWRDAHGGAWPVRLEDVVPGGARSHMGAWRPPPFRLEPGADGRPALTFPISSDRQLALDLADGRWSQSDRRTERSPR